MIARLYRILLAIAALAALAPLLSPVAWAQDEAGADPDEATVAAAAPDLLGEGEFDELVAPVALYPDSLLAQIFVAATVPLEVVKADRFLSENAALDDKARAEAAEAQDWDPSVQVLAGGFPTVVQRMAEAIDWTEELGDAVLAQTDDVLDAVQRMRARAAAVGNLESNEAQSVDTDGDAISIAPADPDVIYVPTYDPATAFTTPAQVVVSDPGISAGDVLAAGAIAFGTALLIDEIFDDDDPWDYYWRGPRVIDWNDGAFYPRRDVDIDIGEINIDRDRVRIERGDRVRIGDRDPIRGQAFAPSADQRQAARDKLAARERPGGARDAAQARVAARTDGDAGAARARLEQAQAARAPARRPPAASSALQPHPETRAKVSRAAERGRASASRGRGPAATGHRAGVAKAAQARPAAHRSPPHGSAFQKHASGPRTHHASRRGGASAGRMHRR